MLNPELSLHYSITTKPEAHLIKLRVKEKEMTLLSVADKNIAEHIFNQFLVFHKTINQCNILNDQSVMVKKSCIIKDIRGMSGVIINRGTINSNVVIEGYKTTFSIPNKDLE